VRTSYSSEDNMLTASVIDTGTGIDQEIITRVFDPFFTTKSVGKGTGLGLSVSYGIIEDHKGSISIESPVADRTGKGLHPGTAMHIKLPVPEADNPESDALHTDN